MNILLTSVGIRNKVIQYFKSELGEAGTVFAADCSEHAPALYEAEHAFLIPELNDGRYLSVLKDICRDNNISAVISLINPELTVLARAKDDFQNQGISCIVSNETILDTCIDKYELFKFLTHHQFLSPEVFIETSRLKDALDNGRVHFPLMAKRRRGSGSVGQYIVESWDQVEVVSAKPGNDMIFEQYLKGPEYGMDIYVDLISRKVVSAVPKKVIRMRAGEADKVVSVDNEGLIKLGKSAVESLGIVGPCNVDFIETDRGPSIIDINPRFGGGYPFSHECGANFVKMILNNLNGKVNPDQIGNYSKGKYLYKYYEICSRDLQIKTSTGEMRSAILTRF